MALLVVLLVALLAAPPAAPLVTPLVIPLVTLLIHRITWSFFFRHFLATTGVVASECEALFKGTFKKANKIALRLP